MCIKNSVVLVCIRNKKTWGHSLLQIRICLFLCNIHFWFSLLAFQKKKKQPPKLLSASLQRTVEVFVNVCSIICNVRRSWLHALHFSKDLSLIASVVLGILYIIWLFLQIGEQLWLLPSDKPCFPCNYSRILGCNNCWAAFSSFVQLFEPPCLLDIESKPYINIHISSFVKHFEIKDEQHCVK